jgi:MFS family permease
MPRSFRRDARRNIPINYLFSFIASFDVIQGLWMIYLRIQGLSLWEIGIAEGFFHLTSFVMEAPTGMVADLWGHKASRLAGRFSLAMAMIILLHVESLPTALAAFFFIALSYNLESGSGEALVYESVEAEERPRRYSRILSYTNAIVYFSLTLAVLVGGFLAERWGYPVVFMTVIGLSLAAFAVGSLFVEPPALMEYRSRHEGAGFLAAFKRQSLDTVSAIRKDRAMAFLVFYTELAAAFYTTAFFYLQTYWKGSGLGEARIGIYLAMGGFASIVGGLIGPVLERRVGFFPLMLAAPTLYALSILALGVVPGTVPLFVGLGLLEGLIYLLMTDFLQKRIPSQLRATLLSLRTMVFSFSMILVFPLAGWIGSAVSEVALFRFLGVTSVVLLLPYLWYLLRRGPTYLEATPEE